MLYHYTTAELGNAIRRTGAIRPAPVIVFEDLLASKKVELAPAVWLTISPELDGTVYVKGLVDGVTDYWRFGIKRDDVPDLADWAFEKGYPPALFHWMLLTSKLVGVNYEDWRLSSQPLTFDEWAVVEHNDGNGWKPVS